MEATQTAEFLTLNSIEVNNEFQRIYLGPIGLAAMRRNGATSAEIREAEQGYQQLVSTEIVGKFSCPLSFQPHIAALIDRPFRFTMPPHIAKSEPKTYDWFVTEVEQRTMNGPIIVTAHTCGAPYDTNNSS